MDKNINRINVVLKGKKKTNKWLGEQLDCVPTTISKLRPDVYQSPLVTYITLFFLYFFVTSLPIMAQSTSDNSGRQMVVWHKDGSKVLFSLSEKPMIKYQGDSVSIKSSVEISYHFQAIQKVTFEGEPDPTSVPDITSNPDQPFSVIGDVMTFVASDSDMHVRIVTSSGLLVKDFIVSKGNQVSISLSEYRSKVLLIVAGGVTYKIIVP